MSEFYRVVFKGEIAEGFDEQEVKKDIAKILKKDLDTIEKLFSGKNHVIKKAVDRTGCVKAKEIFKKYGAVCHIKEPTVVVEATKEQGHTFETDHSPPQQQVTPNEPSKVEEIKENFSEKISEVSTNLKPGISEAKDKVSEKLSNVSEQLKPGLDNAKEKASATFSKASESIKTDLESGGFKSLLKNKFAIGGGIAIVIVLIMALSLFTGGGSNDEPSKMIIKEIAAKAGGPYWPNNEAYPYSVINFKITNQFTKTINGETIYVYETNFKLKIDESGKNFSDQILHSTFGITKRGKKWYKVL